MKKALIVFSCVFIFTAFSFAQNMPEPKHYKIGSAEVWAVADIVDERTDFGIFITDEDTIKKYIPSGKAASAIMVFVIKTGKEVILVDTGLGNAASGLMPGLKKIGVKPEDITLVLITHMHGDHIAGLVWEDAAAFPNARVKIGRTERNFWTAEDSEKKFPSRKANFDLAKKVVGMYGDAVEVFEFGDEVAKGITSLDASGHTPGMSAFLLESKGKKLLFIGDIINGEEIQLARTDISSRYDMDPEKAAKTREAYMKKAADEKIPVAGAHLSFPALGDVKKVSEGYKCKKK